MQTTNDKIVKSVMDKLNARSIVGLKKYGKTLMRDDLTEAEWILHFQEENLDAANYAERKLEDLRNKFGPCEFPPCNKGILTDGSKCWKCKGTGVRLAISDDQQNC